MATIKNIFGKKGQDSKKESQETTAPVNAAPPAQQPEPNPAVHLETAMVDNARNDNPETRAKVYQEILFSDILLALADHNPDAPAGPETAPGNVNVAILSNPQGVQFAAGFTSAAAARRWRTEGGHYIAIRGQDIFKLLEPSPIEVFVINPGSAPFVFLSKVDCRQLAMGVIPQKDVSPVQIGVGTTGETPQGPDGPGPGGPQQGMQIAFPPDAFNDAQRQHVFNVLANHDNIEAVALGAILPPNVNPQEKDNWLRTIFLRVSGLEENQEIMQKFCVDVRESVQANTDTFVDFRFEVGVMPDPNFWIAVHQNKFVLLDKKPPVLPQTENTNA